MVREFFGVHHHDGMSTPPLHHVANNVPVVRVGVILDDGVKRVPSIPS